MSRKVVLCDKYGSANIEVENVEVGYEYELIKPIIIKDKDGKARDTVTKVILEKEPTRKNQREWGRLSEEDQIDRMILDLTNLKAVHVDEIGLKDLANVSELLKFFLPENLLKEIAS